MRIAQFATVVAWRSRVVILAGSKASRSSGELREIFGDRAADFAGENFRERRNGAGGFVKSDALHAVHREEECWKAGPFLIGTIDLVDEVIEGVEIDAANGDSRRVDGEKFAPEFFFRSMEADDDDGVRVHGFTFPA
jgi:hypothetical protein